RNDSSGRSLASCEPNRQRHQTNHSIHPQHVQYFAQQHPTLKLLQLPNPPVAPSDPFSIFPFPSAICDLPSALPFWARQIGGATVPENYALSLARARFVPTSPHLRLIITD